MTNLDPGGIQPGDAVRCYFKDTSMSPWLYGAVGVVLGGNTGSLKYTYRVDFGHDEIVSVHARWLRVIDAVYVVAGEEQSRELALALVGAGLAYHSITEVSDDGVRYFFSSSNIGYSVHDYRSKSDLHERFPQFKSEV